MAGKRSSRNEWRKRVDRWKDSGLTAKEFAAETGINAGTLQFWKYKLRKGEPVSARRSATEAKDPILSSIVEVQPEVGPEEMRFEIDLANGRRLRVPAAYEASALKALLAILEATA
jgi:hypothetical protein